MAQSVMSATNRLGHQDVQYVHGLSAADPCLRLWISGRSMPKDAGLLLGRACRELGLGASGWQAQLMRITQTSARANGAVEGLSPGHGRFKACRLISLCW